MFMSVRLSEAQQEIMQEIWAAGRPITCEELRQRLAGEREWKTTTVLTFLSRLVEKGMLTVTKRGRTNLYAARMTQEEYRGEEARAFSQTGVWGQRQADGGVALRERTDCPR